MSLTHIHPKLPMREKETSLAYYVGNLGFEQRGGDFPDYLMMGRDGVELHLFSFPELNPATNYGQVYIRLNDIHRFYQELIEKGVPIHPNGALSLKAWGMWEFSLLDPDCNLITFGEEVGLITD